MIRERFQRGKKQFAVLVDPDRNDENQLTHTARLATAAGVDMLFVGSSLLLDNGVTRCVRSLKEHTSLPVVLFPGHSIQVTSAADAMLFLTLISGRNPELLIGQQVVAAPFIKRSGLEVIPTGYLLIDSGAPTSASYMSQTAPIPYDKDDIAAATAMAGELLGLKSIYLDGGSGARMPIRPSMIHKVRASVELPIIVGGGIRTPEQVSAAYGAGADVVVVGNSLEENPELLFELATAVER